MGMCSHEHIFFVKPYQRLQCSICLGWAIRLAFHLGEGSRIGRLTGVKQRAGNHLLSALALS
jgi:hypothetical protein